MKSTILLLKTITLTTLILLASLSKAQNFELWGMTYAGGDYGVGTIFKTDSNGNNHTVQESFLQNQGHEPDRTILCQAANGKFYGVASAGGTNNLGVIFEYDPSTSTYIKKFDFDVTYPASIS